MNKTRSGFSRQLTLGALLLALALAPLQAQAQSDPVVLNFVNADIPSVIKAVGELTGKIFIINPRVKGTVIITSAKPVPRSQVYPILLSALCMQGFSAIESRGVVKIVPEAEAKQNFSVTRGKQLFTQVGMCLELQPHQFFHDADLDFFPVRAKRDAAAAAQPFGDRG